MTDPRMNPENSEGRYMNLKNAHQRGMIKAAKDMLRSIRSQGGDVALVKLAHDLLLHEPNNADARWIFEMYEKDIPQENEPLPVSDFLAPIL